MLNWLLGELLGEFMWVNFLGGNVRGFVWTFLWGGGAFQRMFRGVLGGNVLACLDLVNTHIHTQMAFSQ